jgi:hypothetical protein
MISSYMDKYGDYLEAHYAYSCPLVALDPTMNPDFFPKAPNFIGGGGGSHDQRSTVESIKKKIKDNLSWAQLFTNNPDIGSNLDNILFFVRVRQALAVSDLKFYHQFKPDFYKNPGRQVSNHHTMVDWETYWPGKGLPVDDILPAICLFGADF